MFHVYKDTKTSSAKDKVVRPIARAPFPLHSMIQRRESLVRLSPLGPKHLAGHEEARVSWRWVPDLQNRPATWRLDDGHAKSQQSVVVAHNGTVQPPGQGDQCRRDVTETHGVRHSEAPQHLKIAL